MRSAILVCGDKNSVLSGQSTAIFVDKDLLVPPNIKRHVFKRWSIIQHCHISRAS